jgi:hypothetical protein
MSDQNKRIYEIVDSDVSIIMDIDERPPTMVPPLTTETIHSTIETSSNDIPTPSPQAMSDTNKGKNQIVDFDVSLIKDIIDQTPPTMAPPTTTENTHSTIDTGGNDIPMQPPLLTPPPPMTPYGQIIDAKNTLQSFDHVNQNVPAATKKAKSTASKEHTAVAFMAHQNPPRLPNGEIINAKNINRSYVVPPADNTNQGGNTNCDVVAPILPTLPNGEVINAKNINQTYNKIPPHIGDPNNGDVMNEPFRFGERRHPTLPAVPIIITNQSNHVNPDNFVDSANTTNGNNSPEIEFTDAELMNNSNNDSHPYVVEATAVNSHLIVDAQPLSSWQQCNGTFWVVIGVVIIVIVAVIGGVCGSGQCMSSTTIVVPSIPTSDNGTTTMDAMKGIIVMEFLKNITLSGKNITVNGTNAESRALMWMLDKDVTLNATLLNSLINNTASFHVRQRYPLITLWFQQRDNVGAFQKQWYNTTGWLQDANECNWYGIYCTVMDLGGSVGMQDVVTEIDFNCVILTKEQRLVDYDYYLYDDDEQNILTKNGTCSLGNNYTGSIPADLGLLTYLDHLDFSLNELTGTIPASVGQWTALTYFDVSKNDGLIGSLPESIGNWTDLKSFVVGGANNPFFDIVEGTPRLNGTLPESMGQWTVLTSFILENTLIVGPIPDIVGQWTMLEFFQVSGDSSLDGPIPESIGQWTALTHFGVNGLTGTLPESIGGWTALESFVVNGIPYGLTGTLPDSIGQWTALTHFVMSNTARVNGTIPASIGQWTNLLHFELYDVLGLNGTIPESIGQWTALTSFTIAHNQLSATLPDSILSGSLPESIGKWSALNYFEVYGNYGIAGTLPASIGQWTELMYFLIYSNALNGTLPQSIGQWSSMLEFFVVYNSSLTGTLPEFIGEWTALTEFNVGNNEFIGTIPLSIGNWRNITSAGFSQNNFTGSVPNEFCTNIEDQGGNVILISADCLSEINCSCCNECE